MVTKEQHLRIAGLLEQVPGACDFVAEVARMAGFDDRAIYHCQLAVDEACTNIIEHGYELNGADQVIDLICRTEPKRLIITILDDSPPFDPLSLPSPDPTLPLELREEGGWGIHFIRKLMDEVYYVYENRRNCLTIIKRLA